MADNQRITIADVAKHAGVSQTTVSRVINGDPAVKSATREQVQSSVKLLRYEPNQAARSLAGRRAARVGIFFEKPYGGYTAELLVASLRECSRRGHVLVAEELDTTAPISRCLAELEKTLPALSAAIMPPLSRGNQALIELLNRNNMPVVALAASDADLHQSDVNTVGIDDFMAAREVVDHLLEHGHRRIGFIRGLEFQNAARRRFEGYSQALAAAGLAQRDELIEQGDFTFASGMTAMERLLASKEPPTAVFASNDDMAAGAIGHAFRAGFRVPEDISIVGFDDSPMAQSVSPLLTSVQQPLVEMISIALDLLEQHQHFPGNSGDQSRSAHHHLVGHRVVTRSSVMAPRTPK